MKRLRYISFLIAVIILFIPLCIIAFIFAGVDALTGIGLYDKLYNLIDRIKRKALR
jgi:hypothetical protein